MESTHQRMSNSRHRIPLLLVAAALMAALFVSPRPAVAEGALAIGLPADVAQEGVAFGYTVNFESQEKASTVALEHCRTTKDSTAAARALCKVVKTFHHQCVAIAMDPKDGTPGVGWAVAATKPEAEKQALNACIATAGESRRGACQVSISVCDAPSTR